VAVYTEAALMKQMSDLRAARLEAEHQREELMQRAQRLQNRYQDTDVTGM